MENSDFDKFIRSSTQKELHVPDGLEWDNMNIPLPKKKKKNRFFVFILLGILGLVVSVATWSHLNNTSTNKNFNNITPEIQQYKEDTNPFTNLEKQNIYKEENNLPSTNENTPKPSTKNTRSQNDDQAYGFNTKVETIKNNFVAVEDADKKQSALSVSTAVVEIPTPITSKSPTKIITSFSNIQGLNPQLAIPAGALLELNLPTYFQLKTPSRKKKMLLLSFGLNSSQSNYSKGLQTNTLTDAEQSFWGKSFQSIFQYEAKKGFFGSIGLGYHRLHNIFTFREDLGSTVNSIQQQRISETRNVFYNNFFDLIELKIGGGKHFYFGKNWGSQVALHFNPSYKINSSGRTLNDEESIVIIEEFDAKQKLFLNASADLKIFYTIKKNSIFLGAGYARSLNDIKFLENSDLKFRPTVLNFNLGISRRF